MTIASNGRLTKKDLKSDQEVRWCPGCGDYAVLNGVQSVLANLGIPREKLIVVSGIGCSSRFPYYMNTYGFHSIHGRAPAVATGIKISNPELSVWVITGDGDALSIGGNHLIHLLRRNVGIKVLLFNNEIYGLTKGQYSPTSRLGIKTKATPFGSIDHPFNPISVALGSGATFVARTIDSHQKHLTAVLEAAARHEGTAFIEVFQNCVIFNDGAFDDVADKKRRDERTIDLKPGEPLVYGSERDKGLKIDSMDLVRVPAAEATVWNPSTATAAPGFLMAEVSRSDVLPTPIGIFRDVKSTVYETEVHRQIETVTESKGSGALKDLIYTGDMWTVA